jgi:S-disulfanyl-L-cysteine oxidoreductase SoxD
MTPVQYGGSGRWFIAMVLAVLTMVQAFVLAQKPLGIGRVASPDEIAKLDIDVRADGKGLPEGKGTVAEGAKVYAAKCQSCHGATGQGGSADRLVDRESGKNWDFAINPKLVKTVGNYWPYATTLYDYTYRAMPFMQPGTLTPDETYSLVAYILNLNKIVADDAIIDKTTLPKVVMPSRDRFVIDNRKGGKVVK